MKFTKTISLPILLFFSILIFSTCSSENQEETTQQEEDAQQQESGIAYNFRMEMEMLLGHYIDLKNAVVDSDIAAAKESAEELSAFTREVVEDVLDSEEQGLWLGIAQILRRESDNLIAAENNEEIRINFENISTAMIRVADSFDPAGGPYYLMECEEAETGDGQWLSREEEIRNPYQTSADVSCGEVVEEF